MSLDLKLLGSKLLRYRQLFELSIEEVNKATGISEELLQAYEGGEKEPSGDEILIFADFYKCDFKFFISNERLAPFEQTETLFRKHGNQLSKSDRWSIQEFLFLCECETDLMALLGRKPKHKFEFTPSGDYYKRHGEQAAAKLRKTLNYTDETITSDNVFHDFRQIGIHIFRRKLENSSISGLFITHPTVGKCVLVNYSEDFYRQRFTAAHETGHAILDADKEFNISFDDEQSKLIEVRANTFASRYLLPLGLLRKKIPTKIIWNEEQVISIGNQLQVNPQTLAIALKEAKIVSGTEYRQILSVKIPRHTKADPELPNNLSPGSLTRVLTMLQRGLSTYYVHLCFEAYQHKLITRGRLAETLLVDEQELPDMARLFNINL